MRYIITLILVLSVVMVGCASSKSTVNNSNMDIRAAKITKSMREEMVKINSISQKRYGIDILHDVYVKGVSLVIDINHEAYGYGTQSMKKQTDVMVDQLRMYSVNFKKVDIRYVRVLIDGKFYKEYEL